MVTQAQVSQLLQGGSGLPDTVPSLLKALAGQTFSIVTGAAAGNKMDVAAMRPGDVILAAMVPPAVVTNAVAAAQTITIDATGGHFHVIWNGQNSGPLAWNISAADFTTALVAMSNINEGDVVVTGTPDADGCTYTLTWNASLGAIAAPTTDATGLTGGASTATVGGTNGTTQVSGIWVNDADNMTIQGVKATGTVTFASAQNNDYFEVNGNTYTVKTTPTDAKHIGLNGGVGGARTDAEMAAACVAVVNAYEARYTGSKWNDPAVYASTDGVTGVVTFTAIKEGAGNAPIVTGTVTKLAAANSGTAAATLTAATVVVDNTCSVNGVTFTAKAEPTGDVQFDVKGTDAAQATEITRCLNAYAEKYSKDYVASCTGTTGVVTIRPRFDKQGNIITLTSSSDGARLDVSGSGTLAGGTSTGGVKSTTNLTGKSVLLVWSNVDLK